MKKSIFIDYLKLDGIARVSLIFRVLPGSGLSGKKEANRKKSYN
jgi:hypothetical protein